MSRLEWFDRPPARRRQARATRGLVFGSAIVAMGAITGCGWLQGWLHLPTNERIYFANLDPLHAGAHLVGVHPRFATQGTRLYVGGYATPPAPTIDDKIDPVLQQWLVTGNPTRTEELLVTFRDTVATPSFGTLPSFTTATHDTAGTGGLINAIIALRAADYQRLDDSLTMNHGAVAVGPEHPWNL